MIVDDLNVSGIAILPHKAHTPLVVYSNAMLAVAIAAQLFEPVARTRREIA
jgi:hypothetical protein